MAWSVCIERLNAGLRETVVEKEKRLQGPYKEESRNFQELDQNKKARVPSDIIDHRIRFTTEAETDERNLCKGSTHFMNRMVAIRFYNDQYVQQF